MSTFWDREGFIASPPRRLGAWRGQRPVQLAACAVASCGAAAVLVELPPSTAMVLTGVASWCMLLAVLRGALRSPPAMRHAPASRAAAQAGIARSSVEPRLLAGSRVLYYLGAATIGLLTVRPALSFTLSDWLFLVAIGLAALALLRARKVVSVDIPPLVLAGAAIFALGGLLSSFHAVSPLGSAAVVVRVLYLTLPWFWVGIVLLRTPGQVQRAITAWVASAAVCGAAAVAQVFLGNVIPGGSYVPGGRATGFTSQFNVLGGLTAIAFVPALMIAVQSRGRARLLTFSLIALVATGLLLSGSVGGLLAIAAATSVWLVSSGRARPTLAIAAVLLASALLLFSAKGSTRSVSPFHRLSLVAQPEVPGSRGGTLNSRIGVYHAAWSHIRDEPFVGVGLDSASSNDRIGEVHNVILGPWYTAGILGVLGICILIGSVVHVGFRVVRDAATPDERVLAVALFASVLAFVVFALSEPIIYVRYGWAPVGFLLALRAQQRTRRRVDG